MRESDASTGYSDATDAHVRTSAGALAALAGLVTVESAQVRGNPLYVRLSHIEHGGFLSPQVFGFGVLSATGELVTEPPTVLMPARPPAAGLRSPDLASAEEPFTYAVVANHSVAKQLETALTLASTLLGRQEMVASGRLDGDVSRVDLIAS